MKCQYCGKEFEPTCLRNIFCCTKCQKANRKVVEKKQRAVKRNKRCLVCGKPFNDATRANNRKYCSQDCYVKVKRMKRLHGTLGKQKIRRKDRIADITEKAWGEGLTYGQYKAREYMKTVTWRDPKIDYPQSVQKK